MVSDPPYRRDVSLFEAMETLRAASGSHLDPQTALEKIVESDDRRALVALYETLG